MKMNDLTNSEERKMMWTIEKTVKCGNYRFAVVREHPKATKHGYVLLHRIVMENYLNRLLGDNEVVHHINHDKLDNRIENLQLMSNTEHVRQHKSTGRTKVNLRCPWCGTLFSREKRQTHLIKTKNKYTCCSSSCSGKLSNSIRYNGITDAITLALSQNIQGEFDD